MSHNWMIRLLTATTYLCILFDVLCFVFSQLTLVRTCSLKKCISFTVKPPHTPQPIISGLWALYVYPTVSISMNVCVWFLPLPPPVAVKYPPHDSAITTKRRTTLPAPRMSSHAQKALVKIPMWGCVSLAAWLILASFCLVVGWREAWLSWWPLCRVDGKEESSIKVSEVEGFMTLRTCVCGSLLHKNSPHIAKTRNSMWIMSSFKCFRKLKKAVVSVSVEWV